MSPKTVVLVALGMTGSFCLIFALMLALYGPAPAPPRQQGPTAAPRRAFTIVYLADGCRRAKAWPNFPLDRAGVGVGELMAGPGLPLAWPRPDGELPEPPAERGEATGPQQRVVTDRHA